MMDYTNRYATKGITETATSGTPIPDYDMKASDAYPKANCVQDAPNIKIKDILMDISNIQEETLTVLRSIKEAMFYDIDDRKKTDSEKSMIETLLNQRDTAKEILESVASIRERLW